MKVKLREKKVKSGKVSLYLDIYCAGGRSYEFLNLHVNKVKPTAQDKENLRLANEIRIEREHQLIVSQHSLNNKHDKQVDFVAYFESHIATKKKNNNLKSTLNHLKRFVGNQYFPIAKVTTKWLKDFEGFLLNQVANNSALNYLKNVNSALNELVRTEVLEHNPWHDVPKSERLKKKDSTRTAWTLGQLQKLVKASKGIKKQIQQAYFFACFTGLRWSDINKLLWKSIIRKNVNNSNSKEWFLHFEQQKTKAVEYFPLSDQAIRILQERDIDSAKEPPSPYVFPDIKETDLENKPVQRRINYALKKWAKQAGLEKCKMSFHTGRHSFATNLLEQTGGDLYTVSKLLGHKSIQTTQIYAQVRDTVKLAAVRSLPSLDMSEAPDESTNSKAA